MATEVIDDQALLTESDLRLPATADGCDVPSPENAAARYDVELARTRQISESTGLPLLCVNVETGWVIDRTDDNVLDILPSRLCERLLTADEPVVMEWTSGLLAFGVPVRSVGNPPCAAIGYMLARPDCRPESIVMAARHPAWSESELDAHLAALPHSSAALIERLLKSAWQRAESDSVQRLLEEEIEQLGEHVEQTYEEITLLHAITGNMQISRSPLEIAKLCLDRLYGLIPAQANVVILDDQRGREDFLSNGDLPLSEDRVRQLIDRFESHDWTRPFIKNYVTNSILGSDYPGLESFVIVSIAEGEHRSGWILSLNCLNGAEFGSVEGSLLNSMASILGTHLRNIDLYRQHDELLLGFVRSLVSTLDAKDRYTRGHSERVALIARAIGRKMGLPEEDLRDIYLSGLLHDIGKVGIHDSILGKPGKLTDDEFTIIQEHPVLGFEILSGLNNLKSILPGVRNHHETYSGRGYPDRLQGEEIPLMARILAVADAFDAMHSDRPYRKGMPIEQIETILRRGAGEQWDPRIIDLYFEVHDEVEQICRQHSDTDDDLFAVLET